MRYLHPVAMHEVFVGSGTYRYLQNDAPTGLVEHWTIHELPDGAWFIRVDKDGREFDGTTELLEAWRSPAGVIERFDVVAYNHPSEPVRSVRASYTVEGQMLYCGRTINDSDRVHTQLELPASYILQPGAYLFFGFALRRIVDEAPLAMVTRYGFSDNVDEVYLPGVVQPLVTFHSEDQVLISGQERDARHYISGERDEVAGAQWHHYWVDMHDIFLLHEGPGMRVQLERYALR